MAESGFKDAECDTQVGEVGERKLKRFGKFLMRSSARSLRTKEFGDYCRLLAEMVAQENEFEDSFDRLIMERTADGKSIAEISRELRGSMPEGRQRSKFNRDTIRYVRRRYENKWGIRIWKPEQMVSRKVRIR